MKDQQQLPARRSWFCRLFHNDPIFAREPDGTPAWECGTLDCRRRWLRFPEGGKWRPEDIRKRRRKRAQQKRALKVVNFP